mgnify:CR=1 FL=1
MLKTTVVDYGVGNLFSVKAALMHCGVNEVIFAKTEDQILNADTLKLISTNFLEEKYFCATSSEVLPIFKDKSYSII